MAAEKNEDLPMTDIRQPGPYRQTSFRASESAISRRSNKERLYNLGRKIKDNTANFFGVGGETTYDSAKWEYRRVRLLNKQCGPVKQHKFQRTVPDGSQPQVHDPLRTPHDFPDTGRPPLSAAASMTSYRRAIRQHPQTARRRKESIFRIAYESLGKPKKKKTVGMRQPIHSRTFSPASVTSPEPWDDIDSAIPTTAGTASTFLPPLTDDLDDEVFFDFATPLPTADTPGFRGPGEEEKDGAFLPRIDENEGVLGGWGRRPPQPLPSTPGLDTTDGIGMRRIVDNVVEKVMDNSERRQYGMGFVGECLNWRMRKRENLDRKSQKQLDDIEDSNFRPYFTYWVTFVQLVIYIVSVAVYGIAPIGFEETMIRAEVMTHNLAIEQVSYLEKDNFFIGPRRADLIHLGAKYSPCMRRDMNVYNMLSVYTSFWNKTGCCIRNDGSGCVQKMPDHCLNTMSTVKPGKICGTDPERCAKPRSIAPYEWPGDRTEWPICKEKMEIHENDTRWPHVTCEMLGRPCCIGLQGQCKILSREDCDFRRGYFHEEAFLCSQVSCLGEVCGMIPFANKDYPDQVYRLWTSLFLHVGLVHLVVSIAFQFILMRDLEKMAGPIRICAIYMLSGIAGNLASAIFLPYQVEVGPAGCQFGILSCLFAEYVQNWPRIERPCIGLLKMIGIVILFFLLGLLPWIDNYAHVFGFCFGFLLSYLLLPYVSFGRRDAKCRIVTIVICSISVITLFVLLILLFYVTPIYECDWCSYFNCIPITDKWCDSMQIRLQNPTVDDI